MKPLIMIVAACSLSMATMAQQSKVFIKGGLNLANISNSSDGDVDDAKTLASWHVGVMADLPIGQFFAIQPGLLFTGKGSKIQNGNSSDNNYYKATTNPMYIELPVNAVFKIPLETNSQLFVGAGPYIAMGVAGKRKIEGKILGVEYSRKDNIEFSNDDPTTLNEEEGVGLGIMRRFDAGLNATAGLIINKFLVQVNYGHGLTKLQSGADNGEDNKNKHRVLSLSVGIGL
ncbi:MAG: porin family protein [Pseudobacter sp.]|uniref:porin family protein n=1 Tax=Pseudobacter sp. TaxID=2045420 RepID=UPI003F7F79E3